MVSSGFSCLLDIKIPSNQTSRPNFFATGFPRIRDGQASQASQATPNAPLGDFAIHHGEAHSHFLLIWEMSLWEKRDDSWLRKTG